MTRNVAIIGLIIALGGCQNLKDIGTSTAEYVKTQRTPKPTPMELYFASINNPFVPLGSFGDTLDGDQGQRCRDTIHSRAVPPEDMQFVTAASESGNASCQHVLGTFYESGNGVPKDRAKARRLYLKAAATDPYAYVELGRMARDGVDEPVNPVKSRDYYTQAGVAGAVGLGGLMEQGKGGVQDVPGAMQLYISATQKHDDPAWKAMRSLLDRGFKLDTGQMQKYNKLWIDGFIDAQHLKLKFSRALNNLSELKRAPESSQSLTVKVLYEFPAGSSHPVAYLAESCGDPMIDKIVVSALRNVYMNDSYIVPEGQEIPPFVAPIVVNLR